MGAADFFWFFIIQVMAGLITGATSFGGGLFAIPLMTLFVPLQQSIVIACISFAFVVVLILCIYWRDILWREIFTLGGAGIMGVPFGTWLLAHANLRFLFLAAGIAIFLFLLWQWLMPRLGRKETILPAWWAGPCGFLGGLMTGTVGMGGPPLVFYAYLRHWTKENTIGGIAAVSALLLIMVIFGQWIEGLYTWPVFTLSLWAALGT